MAQLKSTNIYGSLAVTDTISEGGILISSKYALSDHTHATSMASSSGTSKISLAANTKYSINTGGTSYIFTTPPDTTYESKSAASGGTDVSLVTTGEKYTWNNKTSNTGTVTSITINASSPISIDSNAAITTSGTRTISHANSGATAGSYGDSSAQTPAYGGTFKVPYVTVNATGHVTGISEHTVKIPASDNTWRPQPDWNATSGDAVIKNKPSLATVATSGSYNDLSNKPTIPTVNNSTITIKQTGISDQTFTLNGSATTITLADTNTWRPIGTGANDCAAGNHTHSGYAPSITTSTSNSAYNILFNDGGTPKYGNTTNKTLTFNPSTGLLKSYDYATNHGDLAEDLECQSDLIPEPGYCYSFDGERYYKTTEYADRFFIGIHSDTAGYILRNNDKPNVLRTALAGFVLAYVDKEYPVGTPLTCTKGGILTEASKEIRSEKSDMVVAKYWRAENKRCWEDINVNGRHWVKVLH